MYFYWKVLPADCSFDCSQLLRRYGPSPGSPLRNKDRWLQTKTDGNMSWDTGVANFSNRAKELTSLSRQHDSISPVVHWKAKREGGMRKIPTVSGKRETIKKKLTSIGNITALCTSRTWVANHGLEHLRGSNN
jgi:hypothetical protein